ncbi:MAG: metallophosphoesterase [Candidatus Omnitrophota bacterium]
MAIPGIKRKKEYLGKYFNGFCIALVIAALFFTGAYAGDKRPIIIVGDSQRGHDAHREVISAIIKKEPVAVFQLGDLVDDGRSKKEWEIFNEITAPLRSRTEYYPLLGNHEFNSGLYYDNFQLPNNEEWYYVDKNHIRFIVLDSNAQLSCGSEQYIWFENALRSGGGIDFLIVLLHHPFFTTAARHIPDERGLLPVIMPLLEKYRVDAVFSGHNHDYERSFYNGIYFIVSGGGGAPLDDQVRQSPYSQKFVKQYHFCELMVQGTKLLVSVSDKSGALIDSFSIESKRGQASPLAVSSKPDLSNTTAAVGVK